MPDSNATQVGPKARWRRWCAAVVALAVLYVAAYFPLMDRSRPTTCGYYKNYQSSFRWARPMPDKDGSPTKYPDTTIWNVLYEPVDNYYFRRFPRSHEEMERLRNYGYDIRDQR
jgi:hypothetical protein